MSTRKSSESHAASPAADAAPWNDLPRQQMAALARASCAVFRGFESIRRIQQATAQQALSHHQGLVERLKEPCAPMDLLALQADLLRFDAQGAALYWQQLGLAALRMQRELASAAVPERGGAEPADAGTAGEGLMPGLNPFFFFQVDSAQQRAHAA